MKDILTDFSYAKIVKEIEDKLSEILINLLNRQINVNDNFLLVGIDSLGATQFISRINKFFATKIHLNDFFENPTISTLAKVVYDTKSTNQNKIKVLTHADLYDAYFLQKKEYLTYLIKGRNIFNMQLFLTIRNLNSAIFAKTIKELIERHSALRTTFIINDNEIKIKFLTYDPLKFKTEFIDFSKSANINKRIEQITKDLLDTSFDFENGPLFRTLVIKISEDISLLLLVAHHVICDATSINIIKNDIMQLYNGYVENDKSPLNFSPFQIEDYANWNNELLSGPIGKQCKEFYFDRISKSLEEEGITINSRVDKNQATYKEEIIKEIQSYDKDANQLPFSEAIGHIGKLNLSPAASYIFFVEEELMSNLKKKSANLGSSLAILLISVFCISKHKVNSTNIFRIDIPVTTRIAEEFENLVGWVMGGIVACLKLNESLTIKEYIKLTSEIILEATRYRYYPVEQMLLDFDLPINIIAPTQINFIKTNDQIIKDFESKHINGMHAFYDLTCNVFEGKNGLRFFINYNSNLFTPLAIEALFNEYKSILKKIVVNDETMILKEL